MRQIILDTETTGLSPKEGHRIIEIGCVEMVNRRLTGNHFHQYLNPEREIDAGAIAVHGISNEFLADKPLFASVAEELMQYLEGAELVIHNAPFDVGFLNHELQMLAGQFKHIEACCTVLDTLQLARKKHPGQKNNLDALCKRYHVDNSNRELHGALLDAQILAQVYLAMTGGQGSLFGELEQVPMVSAATQTVIETAQLEDRPELLVVKADADELAAHATMLELLKKSNSSNQDLW
jgi:DNA polymerase-3 subunit epsilon